MRRRARGLWLTAALALIAVLAPGCGDDEATVSGTRVKPGMGDTLVYALAGGVREVDPLRVATRSEQLVSRQVHEPLVARLDGPFGDVRRQPGLARSWHSSPDGEIWRFRLRRAVRFQDGIPFNAGAVAANAERWRTSERGRELLPELVAADSPRPDLVRFVLSRRVADLPGRLASPRLGIVSPGALRPAGGREARLSREVRSGTGPFELRELERQRVVLARNVEWWGTRAGLGPALNQVELHVVPAGRDRLEQLARGSVQAADALPPAFRDEIREDPLLTAVGGSGDGVLGMQRSVRGIESASAIESLSGVWLTRVAGD